MLCRTGPGVHILLKIGGARQWRDWSRVSGPNLWIRVAELLIETRHGSAHFFQRWSSLLGTQGNIFCNPGIEKRDHFGCQIPDPKWGPQFSSQL